MKILIFDRKIVKNFKKVAKREDPVVVIGDWSAPSIRYQEQLPSQDVFFWTKSIFRE
jgi:hypothetical protein